MSQELRTVVLPAEVGLTLAALLRRHLEAYSWSQVRRLVATRRVRINGELCLDPARRVKLGDAVELTARPAPVPRLAEAVVVRYLDADLVVVEKPAGLSSTRHPSERFWPERRKALTPTLEDVVPRLIAQREKRPLTSIPRLRIVHRLDKETSGLLVLARTVAAEQGLGRQFHRHTVTRRYLALVHGTPTPGRIVSRLVRDRGDGRRGSSRVPGVGKEAITHVEIVEALGEYTLVSCRLETGRTHQIRIHLAEQGHPICGEKVYHRPLGGEP
ncbi:MAG: RluA family pseudouridine synthase, partial [Gemmataceae bacterium]|nr:RluA family pseudouridine synthase [Gemmataceae bacterium]